MREGIGSIVLAAFVLCLGGGFLGVTTVIVLLGGLSGTVPVTMLFVFGGTGLIFVGFAAVCFVDAIVELGGREPPRWRWYQVFCRPHWRYRRP